MAIVKGLGFHLFALASLLCLAISVNADEYIDNDERLALLPKQAWDLELKNYFDIDVNADAKPENVWPLMRNRRVQRGVRFSKIAGASRGYHTAPKQPAAFPHLVRARPKTAVQGGGGLRKRWEDKNTKTIYEWDSQHGELEAYNKRGQHLGAYNAQTGQKIKEAVPGRRIDP